MTTLEKSPPETIGEQVEGALSLLGDDWEELCEALAAARRGEDVSAWTKGEIALRIETRYGESSLPRAAAQAGVGRSSLYRARDMVRFYPPGLRYLIGDRWPAMTRTHMREAKRLPPLGALKVLCLAQHGTDKEPGPWTSERLRVEVSKRLGKEVPPHKKVLFSATVTLFSLPAIVAQLTRQGDRKVKVTIEEA